MFVSPGMYAERIVNRFFEKKKKENFLLCWSQLSDSCAQIFVAMFPVPSGSLKRNCDEKSIFYEVFKTFIGHVNEFFWKICYLLDVEVSLKECLFSLDALFSVGLEH